MKRSVMELAFAALLTALLFVQQVALSVLPNVHLCAVLILWYTVSFPRLLPLILPGFLLLEGIFYGFGLWWLSYLYIWPLLALAALLLRKKERPASMWAALAGAFGLSFGFLCAIPYFFIGGPAGGVSYWISGIPFDLVHCASNTLLTLVLWKPLRTLAGKLERGLRESPPARRRGKNAD